MPNSPESYIHDNIIHTVRIIFEYIYIYAQNTREKDVMNFKENREMHMGGIIVTKMKSNKN